MSADLHRVQGQLREVRTNDPDQQLLLVPDVLAYVVVPTSYYPSHRLHSKISAARALALLWNGWVAMVPAVRNREWSWVATDRDSAAAWLQELDDTQRAAVTRETVARTGR